MNGEILSDRHIGSQRFVHLTIVSDPESFREMEVSFQDSQNRYSVIHCCLFVMPRTEYCFQKRGFSDPIFSDNTDAFSARECRCADIEEWL